MPLNTTCDTPRSSRIFGRLMAPAWAALVLALATTCSTDGAMFISEQEEIAVGLEVDKQIRQEYQVCSSAQCHPDLLNWVNSLGQQMAAKSDRPDLQYTFTLLHSDIVNAFAAPGGFIYLTTGLLRSASTTSEVAGVVGHEIGHVVERHGAEMMEANISFTLLEKLFLKEKGAASTIAGILFGSYMGFVQSKDKEYEADAQGVILAARSNISPLGLVDFFQTLASLSGTPNALSNILSSHPAPQDRITNANKLIASNNINPSGMLVDGDPPYAQVLAWLPPPAGDGQ